MKSKEGSGAFQSSVKLCKGKQSRSHVALRKLFYIQKAKGATGLMRQHVTSSMDLIFSLPLGMS